MQPFHSKEDQESIRASETLVSHSTLKFPLNDLKEKSKDELYGWTERQFPGTEEHNAAMVELERRKKRDNRIRVAVGISIVTLMLFVAWVKGW